MNGSASPAFVEQVGAYLAHWRALGRRYRHEQWLLETLLRELPALGHDDLTADSFQCWFDGRKNHHPNSRRKWAQLLRHFSSGAVAAIPAASSPRPI